MQINTPKVAESNAHVLDLGNWGKVEEVPEPDKWPTPVTFPWFGVQVRVNPTLSDTALVDLIEREGELEDTDPKAAIAVKDFVRECIHESDFDDFWKLGKLHGYTTLEFAEVASHIIAAMTGDPTKESSVSSSGQADTAASSQDDSYSRTIKELEGEGRPDLGEFFLLAQEAGVAN